VLAALQVPGERVELADGALEVLLTDLVVGRGHGSCGASTGPQVVLALASGLAYGAAHAALAAALARPRRVAFVSRNFSACT